MVVYLLRFLVHCLGYITSWKYRKHSINIFHLFPFHKTQLLKFALFLMSYQTPGISKGLWTNLATKSRRMLFTMLLQCFLCEKSLLANFTNKRKCIFDIRMTLVDVSPQIINKRKDLWTYCTAVLHWLVEWHRVCETFRCNGGSCCWWKASRHHQWSPRHWLTRERRPPPCRFMFGEKTLYSDTMFCTQQIWIQIHLYVM